MKKLLAFLLAILFVVGRTDAADTYAAYTETIMDRLEEIVEEKTSTDLAATNLWKSISTTISKAIVAKQQSNQTVHPVLLLLEDRLQEKVLMLQLMSSGLVNDSEDLVSSESDSLALIVDEMFSQLNTLRSKEGLPLLTLNDTLMSLAQNHAEYMVNNNYFSHSEKDGTKPDERATRAGYNYQFFAENIAFGQTSVTQVMKEWMDSADHKANILDPDFKEVGFGYFQDHWVQVFGAKMK